MFTLYRGVLEGVNSHDEVQCIRSPGRTRRPILAHSSAVVENEKQNRDAQSIHRWGVARVPIVVCTHSMLLSSFRLYTLFRRELEFTSGVNDSVMVFQAPEICIAFNGIRWRACTRVGHRCWSTSDPLAKGSFFCRRFLFPPL